MDYIATITDTMRYLTGRSAVITTLHWRSSHDTFDSLRSDWQTTSTYSGKLLQQKFKAK